MDKSKVVKFTSLPMSQVRIYLSWLSMLLGGYILIAPSSFSVAQDTPSPPLIIEELPPGPNDLNFPPQQPPTITPKPENNNQEPDYQVPTIPLPNSRPSTPTPSPSTTYSDYYRVEVEGDSSLLLTQIQNIEPQAFIRGKEGTIQAGLFSERYNAQRRVEVLESQGFQARVVPVDVAVSRPNNTSYPAPVYRQPQPTPPVNPSNDTTPTVPQVNPSNNETPTVLNNSNNIQQRNEEKGYFVIIPASRQDLPTIAAKVAESGINSRSIRQKQGPIGSHVAVGPFATRSLAERWNSYFHWVGMDARLYHK
ncbi:MAG: hypothetical protein WA865_14300 [Spirulinaceae cyanobacterium]